MCNGKNAIFLGFFLVCQKKKKIVIKNGIFPENNWDFIIFCLEPPSWRQCIIEGDNLSTARSRFNRLLFSSRPVLFIVWCTSLDQLSLRHFPLRGPSLHMLTDGSSCATACWGTVQVVALLNKKYILFLYTSRMFVFTLFYCHSLGFRTNTRRVESPRLLQWSRPDLEVLWTSVVSWTLNWPTAKSLLLMPELILN